MNKVTLYLALADEKIDRPLSRALRDRAAALSFGEGNVSYAETAFGEKPRFLLPAGAYFNVTHTENLFLCAVGEVEIGLDAEMFCEKARAKRIAERWFDKEELAFLHRLCEEDYSRAFARRWTEREAAAKFSGAGLKEALSEKRAELCYTDLDPILESLGISAAATLCTAEPVSLSLVCLED